MTLGAGTDVIPSADEEAALVGTTMLVITLEVTTVAEERTVEVVEVVSKLVTPPVVWVKVTGQIVVDSWTITVV